MPDENHARCLTVEETKEIGLVYGDFLIRKPKLYFWEPQPDITAFELAQCLPFFHAAHFDLGDMFSSLPSECQRHFQEQKEPPHAQQEDDPR